MKILRQLVLVLCAVAAIGVLLFLLRLTQSVDGDLHLQRLANIRKVNNLDVALDRALTQIRVSSLSATGDALTTTTQQLGGALDALDKGPQALRHLSPQLDKDLDLFLNTIEDKSELGFDFEARNILLNQRLIQSVDAVPPNAEQALAALPPNTAAAVRDQLQSDLSQLKSEVVTYAVTPTPVNGPVIAGLLADIDAIAKTQPQAFQDTVLSLRNNTNEAVADKNDLVKKLSDFLNRPTGPQLQAVEQAYSNWHERQVAQANKYRLLLAAYAAFLLLVLAYLGVRLARSYRELDRANAGLSRANETLESQVETRTHDLSVALQDLRASQSQLIQSEKMASLGQMVAGVAHEINTPLGYARSNAEIVRNSLTDLRTLGKAQTRALTLMTSETATDEEVAKALGEAQALGESINSEELAGDLDNLLADTDHGLVQIGELVSSLKDFSRVDRSRTDLFNVNDGLDSALKIANNLLKHRVEVIKSYGELPKIECSPSQLNQVFLNLLTNAAQAIDGSGKIYLHTTASTAGVNIHVLDTGCGMPEEVRERIFEPFYTTKPVGKGTGLGLSIVYRIIQDHGGNIEVRSTPGKGSDFKIHLPLKQRVQEEDAAALQSAA
ncbi:MAG: DAHL domain-containing protein [Stenotrophobium sp.]